MLAFSTAPQVAAQKAKKPFVLVIDAGHGGRDHGAPGKLTLEKHINLNVALAFGKLVEDNFKDVKVIYTRKTDVFVPLQKRADIANRNKADLFVSIHTNAVERNKNIVRGAETYSLGMHRSAENLEVAKRENSVITQENNYQQTYKNFDPRKAESYIIFELMQDQHMKQSVSMAQCVQLQYAKEGRLNKGVKQAGFLVLHATSMPSVLTEVGFISHPEEERFLHSKEGVNKLARALYNGFRNYRRQQRGTAEYLPPEAIETPDHQMAEADKPASSEAIAAVVPVATRPLRSATASTALPATDTVKNVLPLTPAQTLPALAPKSHLASPVVDSEKIHLAAIAAPKPLPQPVVPQQPAPSFATELPPHPRPAASKKRRAAPDVVPLEAHPLRPTMDIASIEIVKPVEAQPVPPAMEPVAPPQPRRKKEKAASQPPTEYRVQLFTSDRQLRSDDHRFKKLTSIDRYKEGGLYKYTYGKTHDIAEAHRLRKKIASDFPESFVVALRGGKRVDLQKANEVFGPPPVSLHEQAHPIAQSPVPNAVATVENTPTAVEQPTSRPAKEPLSSLHMPEFRVQLFTSDRHLSSDDNLFKGLIPIDYYKESGLYKYTHGMTRDLAEAQKLRKRISPDFPESFVIALYEGKRIELQKAKELAPPTAASPSQSSARSTAKRTTSAPVQAMPEFRVQLLTSDRQLPADDKLFKGLSPIGHYQDHGSYKYTYGVTSDLSEAQALRRKISADFPEAFVIALLEGKRIDLQKAKEIIASAQIPLNK